MLFQVLLRYMIKKGTIRLITVDGSVSDYGDGRLPRATVRLHKASLEWTLAFYPQLRVGEAYMDGLLTIEKGSLNDFLHIVLMNYKHIPLLKCVEYVERALRFAQRLLERNPLKKARRDVSSHYDLSPRLYDLFLDVDRQYSCAYFETPHTGLEQAQEDKKRHIASKLFLRKGMRVLDIGSGWGGLGIYLAREANCDVTGLTLSQEQLAMSNDRAHREGLAQSCRFGLRDFRLEKGSYDRVVSVGMFEHVGAQHYDEYFSKVRDLLTDDGVCLLHSIGRFEPGTSCNPFIRKYIFPGAEIPSLSTVLAAVERAGLFVTDIEILRLHYAETLKHWNRRFQQKRTEAAVLYDERFCRKWEFYLTGCEESFRVGDLMVFQLQLTKKLTTLPITRDYMHEWKELATDMPSLALPERETA